MENITKENNTQEKQEKQEKQELIIEEVKNPIFNIYVPLGNKMETDKKRTLIHILGYDVWIPTKMVHLSKDANKFSVGIINNFEYKLKDGKFKVKGADLINYYLKNK